MIVIDQANTSDAAGEHTGKETKKQGVLMQSFEKLKLQNEDNECEEEFALVMHIESENEDVVLSEESVNKTQIKSFFQREWQAFKDEKKTKLSDKKKINSNLNFSELLNEWKQDGNENHWSKKSRKQEGECCSELFSTIVIGILFTLLPNCAIVLDYLTASEYLFGNYYIKYATDPKPPTNCRTTASGTYECLEYDPVYGTLTLVLTFIPGLFWSFGLFIQFGNYLRKDKPEIYQRKRMLILFFLPLSLICIVTYPLQLFLVSLISCFNDQDQWILLTTKIGITEGLFNAHFQYMLQLFVFFTRADRHPSYIQYLAAFGSLLFLAYSRIESLLLDRGGFRMSPGQKAWWILRFGPSFLLNCAFKVGSISLIIAMLRFNSIWLYGIIVVTWLFLQILFNEGCLPKRYYYLFIGAGLHAVSVAHIPEEVKLIDTNPDSTKNILSVTRLTPRQLRFNLLFQNTIWFILNCTVIVTLSIVSFLRPDTEISIFWPFITKTYSFKENKVFSVLHIVAPVILIIGLISQVILWIYEFSKRDKEKVKKAIKINKKDDVTDFTRHVSVESEAVSSLNTEEVQYDGWTHVPDKCPACTGESSWHSYVCDDVLQAGVQGRLSQVIYPLMNIWQNVVDKNTA